MKIDSVVKKYGLGESGKIRLDSILWQYEQQEGRLTGKELKMICAIAKRYFEPLGALQRIDDATIVFFERKALGMPVGSISNLARAEELHSQNDRMNLDGLDKRIDESYLGIVYVRKSMQRRIR